MKVELMAVAVAMIGVAFGGEPRTPTVMNIVNFVRGSEPRYPGRDLVEPLREEIKLNTLHHLPNTILMQYDDAYRVDASWRWNERRWIGDNPSCSMASR